MKKILLVLLTFALLASPAWGMRSVGYDDPIHPTVNLDPFSTITATGFTANLSIVNGTAFITNPSVDLSKYQGRKLTLTAGGKTLTGYGKAAGTGETVGAEKLAWINDPRGAGIAWDTLTVNANGHDITSAINDATGYGIAVVPNAAGNTGELVKWVYALTAGYTGARPNLEITDSYAGPSFYNLQKPGAANGTYYATLSGDSMDAMFWVDNGVASNSGSTHSIKQVTAPSATGITIVSTQGGATRNWASDDGIDPNAASFTLTVEKQ